MGMICRPTINKSQLPECQSVIYRERLVTILLEISRLISDQNDLSHALDCLLDYMRDFMGVVRAMINLYHRESGRIFVHRSMGLTPEEQARGFYYLGEGITGKVVATGHPIIVPCIADEPAFLNRTRSLSESDRLLSFLCVPILRSCKVMGTISAERLYDSECLLQKHVHVLMVISHIIAQAVELYLIENVDKVFWEKRTRRLMAELKERFKPSNIIGSSQVMMDVALIYLC